MMAEGMENRFQRHLAMRDRTIEWARDHDLSLYAAPGYESPTVTCVNNDDNIDIGALNTYLRERGMIISNGYGKLKGTNFRIAHMGDTTLADMEELFAAMDGFFS
jgi:aspartate aminotransferase-like enzyme